MGAAVWAPPIGRRRLGAHRLGAGKSPGHLGAVTNGRRRLGAGRFGATVTSKGLL